jgi:hypothetical protein
MHHADVRPMIVLHDALRREFRPLPALVRSVAESEPERAPEKIAPTVKLMQDHHALIDRLGTQIAATLSTWQDRPDPLDGKRLADALDDLVGVLDEHLGTEERDILPIVAQSVTTDEWNEMGKAAGAGVDPALVPVAVGMLMCEGDPEVVELDMARMPPEVWARMKNVAPQAYEAHRRRVFGPV